MGKGAVSTCSVEHRAPSGCFSVRLFVAHPVGAVIDGVLQACVLALGTCQGSVKRENLEAAWGKLTEDRKDVVTPN